MNERETMSRLNDALNNIDSAYAVIAKRHGLTFNALMIVYLMEQTEAITQKQICDALHLPKSTVHSIMLEFVKKGYFSLEAGKNKKEKRIVVTETGQTFAEKIYKETNSIEKNVLSALGGDTCDFLVQTVERKGFERSAEKKIEMELGGKTVPLICLLYSKQL